MGKFEKNKKKKKKAKPSLAKKKAAAAQKRKPDFRGMLQELLWLVLMAASFFFIELFGFFFLSLDAENYDPAQLWPLAFGGLWAAIITCLLRLLPAKAARIGYGIVYFLAAVYAGFRLLGVWGMILSPLAVMVIREILCRDSEKTPSGV